MDDFPVVIPAEAGIQSWPYNPDHVTRTRHSREGAPPLRLGRAARQVVMEGGNPVTSTTLTPRPPQTEAGGPARPCGWARFRGGDGLRNSPLIFLSLLVFL